jgi:thiol-disulfide isomerase/thioredoxin
MTKRWWHACSSRCADRAGRARPASRARLACWFRRPRLSNWTTLDGKTVELSKLRGKPVFIDFWATWCGPCRRALPHTQKLAEKYGKDAHILTINLREDPETVRQFMQSHNYTFTVLMDTDGSVAAQYRVRGIPHFVLIDARGKIQFVQIGYGPGIEQRFETELQKAIRASKWARR